MLPVLTVMLLPYSLQKGAIAVTRINFIVFIHSLTCHPMNGRPVLCSLILLLIAFLFPVSGKPQNLVPNPGFEDYYNCPAGISQVPLSGVAQGVKNWTIPGAGSSDYYNTCGAAEVGIPFNLFGYQPAHGGNAYVGCYTMLYHLLPQLDNYREYVETQLTQPLQKNHLYNVSFYVNTAATDGIPYLQGYDYSFWATDGVGALLSVNYVTGYNLFNYTPQVQQPSGQILSDTAGWTLVSGYVQGNGEQYITIGNYRKYLQMSKTPVMQTAASPGAWYDTISYVYIDDVSVTPVTDATNDTTLCDTTGFSKVLQGYQGGSSYSWNTGDTTSQITIHTPGTYTYQVQFGSYTIKDTIYIRYYARRQLQLPFHDTAACSGSAVAVKAPDSFLAYEWHANGNIYHTQSAAVYPSGTVVLKVTDSCGTMTDSLYVRAVQQQPLTAHFNDTTVCAGMPLQYIAPPGYLSYQWLHGNATSPGQSVTITQPGTVILQVTDSCRTYSDTFIIHHQQAQPLQSLHDTTVCSGTTLTVTAPNGYNTYQWEYGGNTYNSQSITIGNAGTAILHVTDICGMQTDSFAIAYKQLHPLNTHFPDTSLCANASLQLVAPAGYLSYLWQHDNIISSTQAVVLISGGKVVLKVQDSCVTYADSFTVQIKPVPPSPVTADTSVCPGVVLLTLPATGTGLLWYTSATDPTGSAALPIMPAGQQTPFTVYVTQTVNGCESDRASLRISFYAMPVAALPEDTVFCQGDVYSIGYQSAVSDTYRWSSGETTAFIRPAVAGLYQLTVSNACGSASASTKVQIAPCDKCFWIPDAFTPNGDGRNDQFGPVRTCPAHLHYYLLRIYNRWGQVVFESMTPERRWDGSFGGGEQPLGTYTYTLEYKSTAFSPTVYTKGTVELIR